MANNSSSGLGLLVAFILGICVIIQMLSGDTASNNNRATFDPVPAVTNNSFEHRYATERFKQEGFSSSDAKQAADAVIKFHNAQQSRRK